MERVLKRMERIKFLVDRHFGLQEFYRKGQVCEVGRDISEDHALMALGDRTACHYISHSTPEEERKNKLSVTEFYLERMVARQAQQKEEDSALAAQQEKMDRLGRRLLLTMGLMGCLALKIYDVTHPLLVTAEVDMVPEQYLAAEIKEDKSQEQATLERALKDSGNQALLPYAYQIAEGKQ